MVDLVLLSCLQYSAKKELNKGVGLSIDVRDYVNIVSMVFLNCFTQQRVSNC